ncbi:unnamed protein product [Coccothraustes coccothraustes]
MAGAWGGGAVPAPGQPLRRFPFLWCAAAPLRSHDRARPPPLGPGSVKPAGGSLRALSPLGRSDFAAAGDGRAGRVEPLEEADVAFAGGGDSIAVSTVTSFVLEGPESRCERRRGPSAGVPASRLCPRAVRSAASALCLRCWTNKRQTPGPRNSEPFSKLP